MAALQRPSVAILVADLAELLTLQERLDPEDVAAAHGAYFDLVRRVVERHGGTLEAVSGPAVVAAFDAADGDGYERAVRAGRELADAVERRRRRPRP